MSGKEPEAKVIYQLNRKKICDHNCLNCGHGMAINQYYDNGSFTRVATCDLGLKAKEDEFCPRWMDQSSAMNVGVVSHSCQTCDETNKAIEIMHSFDWSKQHQAIDYDHETEEILVSEEWLMYLIQLANPLQKQKKIRLIEGDEDDWDDATREARKRKFKSLGLEVDY